MGFITMQSSVDRSTYRAPDASYMAGQTGSVAPYGITRKMSYNSARAMQNSLSPMTRIGGVAAKWLSDSSSWKTRPGTIVGGDTKRNVWNAAPGTIGYNYGLWGTRTYAREIPRDKRMEGGPNSYAAQLMRSQNLARNLRMEQNRTIPSYMNPSNVARQASEAMGLGRKVSPGREQRAKARAYYFEGQYGTAGGPTMSTFTISDSMQVLAGQIPAADIARGVKQTGDPTLTNLPPNYYLGLGNQIKGPNKEYAKKLTELRKFGTIGSLHRDTAYGQMAELRKRTAWIREMNMRARQGPMEHNAPDAPGEYQLGAMQGKRVDAWERRKMQLVQELEKKKLHRVGTGERFQQEATDNKQASERGI